MEALTVALEEAEVRETRLVDTLDQARERVRDLEHDIDVLAVIRRARAELCDAVEDCQAIGEVRGIVARPVLA